MNAVGEVIIQKSLNKHTTFYSQMFEPFLLAYWVTNDHRQLYSFLVNSRLCGWLRGSEVEHLSLTGELFLSCTRSVAEE